ncbi:MAG: hypothetical protein QNJ55_32975 [Xenococcus sp. MO_188.B8]|nr:hypothetical protein [Xenococcus sp. MO_188.B8]
MTNNNQKTDFFNLKKISSFLVTVLGTLYLVFILTGGIDQENRRFETPEIIIFSIIVILNSDFIEQLKKLSISKEGFTLEKEVKEQVAKTKKDVEKTKEDLDENKKEIDRLLDFTIKHILNQYELSHLQKLGIPNKKFKFDASKGNLKNELRKLRDLGLISEPDGRRLWVGRLPDKGDDLNKFVKLTEKGKQYLETVEKVLKQIDKTTDSEQ